MERALYIAIALLWACEPPPPPPVAPVVEAAPVVTETPRADACKRGIPDCEAACALRETGRLDYVDWYDRRCAAVILGKNPDGVPQGSATAAAVPPPRAEDLAPNPYR